MNKDELKAVLESQEECRTGVVGARAYLSGADLRGAILIGADLTGADLRGAYLLSVDLLAAQETTDQ